MKQIECIKLMCEVPNQITMPNKTIKTTKFNGKPKNMTTKKINQFENYQHHSPRMTLKLRK
jgi:hypothetical protein